MAKSESNKDVAPFCVGKTVEEANSALENVDKVQCSLEQLNARVGEHNNRADDIMKQLETLNNTVKELENLSSYIKCLHRVEQLRYVEYIDKKTGSLLMNPNKDSKQTPNLAVKLLIVTLVFPKL